ncbi:unnamed protein product [Cuscuta europaea]|uniref:Uncharacterized protein n=1 Tax=Cuscuta europaea TaxID=41803 RepID=A0A9P0YI88_CUSEU|nr:unnamed protein product [Cuscuta europaea]
MDSVVLIMLSLDGSWDNDYTFTCKDKFGMHIRYSSTFGEFMSQLSSILTSYKSHSHFQLSYMVDQCPPPISIHDEDSFRLFLHLKLLQSDFQKLSLCVEFSSDFPHALTDFLSRTDMFAIPSPSNEGCSDYHHHSYHTNNSKEVHSSAFNDHVANYAQTFNHSPCNHVALSMNQDVLSLLSHRLTHLLLICILLIYILFIRIWKSSLIIILLR